MALINCPECKKQISENSEKCINCGFPMNKKVEPSELDNTTKELSRGNTGKPRKGFKILGFSIALVVIAVAFGIYWFSYSPSSFLSLMGNQTESVSSSETNIESEDSDEWTVKVPLDIMNRIEIGMNAEFIKEKLGEPQKCRKNNDEEYLDWRCDMINLSVVARNGAVISVTFDGPGECPQAGCYYFVYFDTIFLCKSTFKVRQKGWFGIGSGIQGVIEFSETELGCRANNFTNYVFSGNTSELSYSDFDAYDFSLTLNEYPASFQEKIILAAKKTTIDRIELRRGY